LIVKGWTVTGNVPS